MKRAALFTLAAAIAWAAPPTIRDIQPRGAQRGKSLTLYVRGDGLVRGTQVRSTLPGSFSQLTLSKDPLAESAAAMRPDSLLAFLVEVRPGAPVGLYPVSLENAGGLSNTVLFSIGEFPELEEIEAKNPKQPNNFAAEAQKIATPVVVAGTLESADIDNYIFTARAGQKLVFEVEARRAGSAIDPAIEIYDSAGKQLAASDDAPGLDVDARVEVAFPAAGQYRVAVRDSKFSDQAVNFYRLKIGSYAFAESVFPLGWKRGEPVEVTLSGGNLAQPVKLKPDTHSPRSSIPLRLPGSAGLPILFALGDSPEVFEVPDLDEAALVNGRISKPGEIDRYKVKVEPGQQWVFEIAAASLGTSQLDALLTLFDASGKKLAAADDGSGIDSVLPFTVPKDVREITVAVEDLLGRGGDMWGYRLTARRSPPDFVAELLTAQV
ncbi:MAG: PPC domain-containing protein, partial [Bryobacteraceae bacterium]